MHIYEQGHKTTLSSACMPMEFLYSSLHPKWPIDVRKATQTLLERSTSASQKQYFQNLINCHSSFLSTHQCPYQGSCEGHSWILNFGVIQPPPKASPALKEALECPSQVAAPAPPATSPAGSATTTHGTGDVQLPEKTLLQKKCYCLCREKPSNK